MRFCQHLAVCAVLAWLVLAWGLLSPVTAAGLVGAVVLAVTIKRAREN